MGLMLTFFAEALSEVVLDVAETFHVACGLIVTTTAFTSPPVEDQSLAMTGCQAMTLG